MNEDGQRSRELFRALRAKGLRRDRLCADGIRFVGQLEAAGRRVEVALTFADLEFTKLPKLTLLNPEKEAEHVVAHLDASSDLCFARNEDLILDRYDVPGSALLCLELGRRGLERALTHTNLEQEIAQEFPQHWLGTRFYYDIQAEQHTRAQMYFDRSDRQIERMLVADNEAAVNRLFTSELKRQAIVSGSQPAFVFYSKADLTLRRDHRQPRTLADFLDWLEAMLPNAGNRAITEIAGSFSKSPPGLFVRAPNGCVGVTVDGSALVFKAAQRRAGLNYLLSKNAASINVERYSGRSVDTGFILERNMNHQSPLVDRRIALIGCGTIGSHLAKFLLQSGAGHGKGTLLLLDNQALQPGNVGRHYLGMGSIGDNKAEGLKAELASCFPDANILPMNIDATKFLSGLIGYDLVVDATGEEALSISINHFFVRRRDEGTSPDVLYVRLFGNGAAAQVLLVDDAPYACFKCLRPDHGGEWRFNPLKHDFEPVQSPATCGESQYIAYGVAAPATAAALALQVALDWNSGNSAPRLRTAQIDKNETRYIKDKNPQRSERCSACRVDGD